MILGGRKACDHRETGGTLVPWEGYRRFMTCKTGRRTEEDKGCGAVFWYDGPSVLDPEDPCRKCLFTGLLFSVSDDAAEALRRII